MSQNFIDLEKTKGFGKDVNDYLNHYITVADAKSAALLASNFIILGALYDFDIEKYKICFIKPIYFICCSFSLISLLMNLYVLFPRLNSEKNKGLIFWENIQNHSDLNEYLDEYKTLKEEQKEEAYAKQNYYVSKVLKDKNSILRKSIVFFSISILLSVISFVLIKII